MDFYLFQIRFCRNHYDWKSDADVMSLSDIFYYCMYFLLSLLSSVEFCESRGFGGIFVLKRRFLRH